MIRTRAESIVFCGAEPTAAAHALPLRCGSRQNAALEWTRPGQTLQLTGTFGDSTVNVTAHRIASPYRLVRGRFHVILGE